MAGKRSTTENPSEHGDAADVTADVEVVATETLEEAGIARASVAAATGVKYVGMAHVREISAADWHQAGVHDQTKVVWDNRVRGKNIVPITEFSPGALEYVDQLDDSFVLVDENGKKV